MINSMTGYGRAEGSLEGLHVNIEIRSVNHRYQETTFKMPKDFFVLEDKMKKIIQQQIKRGRVDVFLSIDVEENPNQQIKVDWNLVDQYIKVIESLKARLQMEDEVKIKDLLTIPDLIHFGQEKLDVESIGPKLLHTLEEACRNLVTMRKIEGNNLYVDLTTRVQSLDQLLDHMRTKAPQVVEEYRGKILARITEWLAGAVEIDESRLLNEVAFFTDKANIDEELTRLKSHFQQFLFIVEQDEPVGRKLDFLLQEMNREINTIGSKANDVSLSQMVVEMKSELEKMREQVQNVE